MELFFQALSNSTSSHIHEPTFVSSDTLLVSRIVSICRLICLENLAKQLHMIQKILDAYLWYAEGTSTPVIQRQKFRSSFLHLLNVEVLC
jgi:hypothetical protein